MTVDVELAEEIAQFYADPLGHVLFSYPWGSAKGFQAPTTGPLALWRRSVRRSAIGASTAIRQSIQFNLARPAVTALASPR